MRRWRRGKVYPDFVFAAIKGGDRQWLVALESKGDQLDNPDAAYKGALLAKLSDSYAKHATAPSGEPRLESAMPDYQAALVRFGDMDAHLLGLIQPSTSIEA